QTFARKPGDLKWATLFGCLGGLAADLDALINSKTDPLLFLEYHRHFTHSLIFIPFGALIVAGIVYPFFRPKVTFNKAYLFTLLGYAAHGLVAACTSYGTLVLWPFFHTRFAWSNISIIEPLFTVPLIGFVLLSWIKKNNGYAQIG